MLAKINYQNRSNETYKKQHDNLVDSLSDFDFYSYAFFFYIPKYENPNVFNL